jgi:hypothetical protein
MLKRNVLLRFSSVMLATWLLAGTPAIIYAQQPDGGKTMTQAAVNEWYPARPPAGMGGLVWLNYNGKGDELTVDLNGTLYKVSEATNNGPGYLQTNLAPGTYTYTASVPDIGAISRTIDVVAGRVTSLSFYQSDPVMIDIHHSSAHSDNGRQEYFRPASDNRLVVAEGDMTAQAR